MELLPIIYYSLIGLGVITIIVIIVSYITFKIRKKIGNIPSEEVKGDERNKKVKITNPDKKANVKKSHHPKVQTVSKRKSTSGSKRSASHSSRKGEDVPYYKKPTKENRKRIEIVNNPNITEETPHKVRGINYNVSKETPTKKGWK